MKRRGCVLNGHSAAAWFTDLFNKSAQTEFCATLKTAREKPGEGVWIKGRRYGWLQT